MNSRSVNSKSRDFAKSAKTSASPNEVVEEYTEDELREGPSPQCQFWTEGEMEEGWD